MKTGRPTVLDDEGERSLADWFFSPRTLGEKAKQLNISRKSMYNYIRKLKQRALNTQAQVKTEQTNESIYPEMCINTSVPRETNESP